MATLGFSNRRTRRQDHGRARYLGHGLPPGTGRCGTPPMGPTFWDKGEAAVLDGDHFYARGFRSAKRL